MNAPSEALDTRPEAAHYVSHVILPDLRLALTRRGAIAFSPPKNIRLRMTHEIDLGGGFIARVDDEDACIVAGFDWRVRKAAHTAYAVARHNGVFMQMHRLLLEPAEDEIVDHVNGDGLDNRRVNIRCCTHAENMRNRAKHADASSPFKGVIGEADRSGWRAEISAGGTKVRLGVFESEHAAAKAYDRAARLSFGRFARTNATLGLYENHPDRRRPFIGKVNPRFLRAA